MNAFRITIMVVPSLFLSFTHSANAQDRHSPAGQRFALIVDYFLVDGTPAQDVTYVKFNQDDNHCYVTRGGNTIISDWYMTKGGTTLNFRYNPPKGYMQFSDFLAKQKNVYNLGGSATHTWKYLGVE